MKIIFLDIDGVLNSVEYFKKRGRPTNQLSTFERDLSDFSIDLVLKLERIVQATGAKIVISSSWRVLNTLQEIENLLRASGGILSAAAIIGKTGQSPDGYRGKEVGAFVLDWTADSTKEILTQWVILDDDSDFFLSQKEHHFVHTKNEVGLTDLNVNKAIQILGKL